MLFLTVPNRLRGEKNYTNPMKEFLLLRRQNRNLTDCYKIPSLVQCLEFDMCQLLFARRLEKQKNLKLSFLRNLFLFFLNKFFLQIILMLLKQFILELK